jgi:cell wall-associated NlpC family hydrolase
MRNGGAVAFAALLFVVVLFLLPGSALASPSAPQIDAYLATKGSPLVGCGTDFVVAGQASGVDPAFLVAISGAETGFGNLLYHEGGDCATFNAWNWFYGPSRAASDFVSWNDGLQHVAQGLAGLLYYGSGRYGVLDIAPVYCPDGTDSWIANVSAFMSELGANPADTRLAPAAASLSVAATTAPAATDSPANPSAYGPQPAPSAVATAPASRSQLPLLEMVGVARASASVIKGGRAEITFTVENTGPQAGRWDAIEVVLRRPDGSTLTCGPSAPLTLASGQQAAFSASQNVDGEGSWAGAVFVFTAGAWGLLGANPAFTFIVTDDVTATVPLQSPGHTATAAAQASPAVAIAQRYLGVPYLWGGADPSGFDCSGLVSYVFAQLGIGLPRTAAQQYAVCTPMPLAALESGDLVFFGSSPATIHHVGIYVGNGVMIDAPHSGALVRYDPLRSDFYSGGRL